MKFSAGDLLADWRPAEVYSDQIETLIENNQSYTTREIVNILKITKSGVKDGLYQLGYVTALMFWFHIR